MVRKHSRLFDGRVQSAGPAVRERLCPPPEGSAPIYCTATNISLCGCYIENMYPFAAGIRLELKLEAGETLLIVAKVVTSEPQSGNGIEFLKILPKDLDRLARFLNGVAAHQLAESAKT